MKGEVEKCEALLLLPTSYFLLPLQTSNFSLPHFRLHPSDFRLSARGFPMPQEFLRDVLRTGDTAGAGSGTGRCCHSRLPAMRSWSRCFLFSPWASSIDLPMIASPLPAHFIETVAPTPPPPPNPPAPGPTVAPPKAPITAPTEITPDLPTSTAAAPDGAIPNGPGVESGRGRSWSVRYGDGRDAAPASARAAHTEAGARRRRDSRAAQDPARRADLS